MLVFAELVVRIKTLVRFGSSLCPNNDGLVAERLIRLEEPEIEIDQ